MNNLLDFALYLFPLAIVIAVALSLTNKNNLEQSETFVGSSISANGSIYKQQIPVFTKNTVAPNVVNPHKFDMTEPFAEKIPFEQTPAAWMQMMSNMMHNMQITQMMHQMAAMPNQMMAPMMWANPHGQPGHMGMLQNHAVKPSPQPMNPEQYKKWYEQQLKLRQSSR
ncbi:MAG: hypothetical protein AB8B92_09535 [Gammaproteobacteria bacterium]